MIQEVISRLATCSFQLKGWVVTLAAALQVFSRAKPIPFTCLCRPYRSLPSGCWMPGTCARSACSGAFYDEVRLKEGAADFSMDTRPFRRVVGSVMQVALSRTLLLFYGPVLIVLVLLESLLLPKPDERF